MTEQSLAILDHSFRLSLAIFLFLFLSAAIIIHIRSFLWRRQGAQAHGGAASFWSIAPGELRSALRSLVLAGFFSALAFVVLTWTPLSFYDNFANSESWRLRPLRLTHITMQRLHEGFVVEGQVYNQSPHAMDGLTARIKVWGLDRNLLAEIPAELTPLTLEAGRPARFKARYEDEPANLYGYEVVFFDPQEVLIPYTQGFDVRTEERVASPPPDSDQP